MNEKKANRKKTPPIVVSSLESRDLTPEEIGDFLVSFRKTIGQQDEPTQLISLRVPANIIRAFKIKAKADGKKYQSMIIQALRDYLYSKN